LVNQGAALIERMLISKRRLHREPDEYTSLAEILCSLRKVSELSQKEIAFRLGIAEGTLAKAEAGMPGTMFQFPTLERLLKLVNDCYLPQMAKSVKAIMLFVRKKKQRGPKKHEGPFWEMKTQE